MGGGGNQRVLEPGKKIKEELKKWKDWGKRREKFRWVKLFYSILGWGGGKTLLDTGRCDKYGEKNQI